MTGEKLIDTVVSATGLPLPTIKTELLSLLDQKNINKNTVTLEELRCILAEYVQDILLSAKDRF